MLFYVTLSMYETVILVRSSEIKSLIKYIGPLIDRQRRFMDVYMSGVKTMRMRKTNLKTHDPTSRIVWPLHN